MQTIGIYANLKKPHAAKYAQRIAGFLRKNRRSVVDNLRSSIRGVLQKSDLIICLGGDGTILQIAGAMTQKVVPVLGVNLGSLGFLTEVKSEEVFEELASILEGDYTLEERVMIWATLIRGKAQKGFQALNDVVINREGYTRYLRAIVKAGGENLMSFPGDGVIVSTPTGSTAYSLSAGGPFIYPTLESFVLTPLSPHSLLARPIVLPADKKIRIELESGNDPCASLTVDGRSELRVSVRDRIEISRSPRNFILVKSSKRSYLETLREKFGLARRYNERRASARCRHPALQGE